MYDSAPIGKSAHCDSGNDAAQPAAVTVKSDAVSVTAPGDKQSASTVSQAAASRAHSSGNPPLPELRSGAALVKPAQNEVVARPTLVSESDSDDDDESDDDDVAEDDADEDDAAMPVTNMFVDVDEKMFVGREHQFVAIKRQLHQKRLAAISGMGGSGKTTFASLYAYRNRKQYKNGILFVDASNINILPLNFAQLAGPELLNLVPRPEEDIVLSTRLLCAWLKTHSYYLLIYDAADDIQTLEKLGKQLPSGLSYIPPRVIHRGHVLITSRLPSEKFDLVQLLYAVTLEDLSLRDTCNFLWQRVYHENIQLEGTEQSLEEYTALETLVREHLPGRLPLNLEQTASFIRGQNLSFADYLAVVMQQNKECNPIGKPGFGDNRKTIDDTFTANFDAVAEKQREAGVLLNIAAVCHSRNIPYALFTVGAIAMASHGVLQEKDIGDLFDYVTKQPRVDEQGKHDLFEKTAKAGRSNILQLLAIPKESQLVKYMRSGNEFSVHEVIQQQLRLRMKKRKELTPTLTTLATILHYMMTSSNISLAHKSLLLAHAEKCAEYMSTFSPPLEEDTSEIPFIELCLRLQMKTAFVFASLGSFPTTWDIITNLEAKVSQQGSEKLSLELLSLKARISVWQHQPAKGLTYGLQGLELMKFGADLADVTDLTNGKTSHLMEYASLRSACALALLAEFETDPDSLKKHLGEALRVFEFIMKTTDCSDQYASVMMHWGLRYRNQADRYPLAETEKRRSEYGQARKWLQKAHNIMDPVSYLSNICQGHVVLVKVELEETSFEEAVDAFIKIRESLDEKLGRFHRYTAWALTKTATLLVDKGKELGHVTHGLELIKESVQIQDTVYDKGSGVVQKGQTKFLQGRALTRLGHYREAERVLEEADELLKVIANNPACVKIQALIQEARRLDRAGITQLADQRWPPHEKEEKDQ